MIGNTEIERNVKFLCVICHSAGIDLTVELFIINKLNIITEKASATKKSSLEKREIKNSNTHGVISLLILWIIFPTEVP